MAPVSQEKTSHFEVAGERRADQRGPARFLQPSGEHALVQLGLGLDSLVGVGVTLEKQLDKIERAFACGAGDSRVLRVPVLDREIERRPSFDVAKIRIGAMIQQKPGEIVKAILYGGQQGASPVSRNLVDRRACRNQFPS